MGANGVDEQFESDDDFEEPPEAPDSSVRLTTACATACPTSRTSSVPIANVRASRPSVAPISMVQVRIVISIGPMLAAGSPVYITLMRLDGPVIFEGFASECGAIEVAAEVPKTAREIKAVLEAGTKYRDAIIVLDASGVTAHAFA